MVITAYNEKGGDGKTSISLLLALELAKKNLKVLAVDCDSQANLTKFLVKSIKKEYSNKLLEPFSINRQLQNYNTEILKYPKNKNLSFIPASEETQKLIEWMSMQDERDFLFHKLLEMKKDSYDIVILDLPPTRSIITTNAYFCVDYLFLIATLEDFSIAGAQNLLKSFFKVKNSPYCQKKGNFEGVILNKINASKKIGNREMIKNIGNIKVITNLPDTTSVPQAQIKGLNLFDYSSKSKSKKNFENEFQKILNYIIQLKN